MTYPKWERDRSPKACPVCSQPSAGHAWIYNEPPPSYPNEDKRKPIDEILLMQAAKIAASLQPHTLSALPDAGLTPKLYFLTVRHIWPSP